MTYYIETEKDDTNKRNVILVRSIIQTRQKNIGTPEEYVNDDPQLVNFSLSHSDLVINKDDAMVDEVTLQHILPMFLDLDDNDKPSPNNELTDENGLGEKPDVQETLPPGEVDNDPLLTPEDLERLYDQFEMEEDT